jgi:hypothetical protein
MARAAEPGATRFLDGKLEAVSMQRTLAPFIGSSPCLRPEVELDNK